MRPQRPKRVKQSAGDGLLSGRVALVTGGAIRLGRAISLALARAGCDVAVNYLRSKPAALATAHEIRALGVEAAAIRADVASPADVKRLVAGTVRRFGRLDLVVNNAGTFFRTALPETTPAQWDRLMNVNLRGPFLLSQAAARVMERSGGRIVNIGDVGGVRAWPSYIPYCVSKAGLLMLTRVLALALAPRIQVNCVAPGAVLLPEGFPEPLRRRLRREVPMGREGDPADVAAAVLFFATAPSYITGQVLFVDGGVTAK
ncbi:MAG: SDR family oxidoreductase [Candidatus Rokubacteria bacterium]|nr:SDR family oxidoreductase [Candidatus Rokubacteria bacterium]